MTICTKYEPKELVTTWLTPDLSPITRIAIEVLITKGDKVQVDIKYTMQNGCSVHEREITPKDEEINGHQSTAH